MTSHIEINIYKITVNGKEDRLILPVMAKFFEVIAAAPGLERVQLWSNECGYVTIYSL